MIEPRQLERVAYRIERIARRREKLESRIRALDDGDPSKVELLDAATRLLQGEEWWLAVLRGAGQAAKEMQHVTAYLESRRRKKTK